MEIWSLSMPTMRDRLNNLSIDQQRQLQYAFENQFAQYVEIGNGKFVGVGVQNVKHLKIEEAAGTWSYGTITKKGT